MTIQARPHAAHDMPGQLGMTFGIGLLTALCLLANPAGATTGSGPKYCTQTATLVRRACGLDTDNAYLLTVAACINLNDPAVRQGCMVDARRARRDSLQACADQTASRLQVCAAVGEDRYDPDFSPANFETDFAHLSITNPYLPINVGNRWDYAGSGQTYRVEILDRTKSIAGVTCVVQHDQVKQAGHVAEDTYDWLAQTHAGSVWYCGEQSSDYAVFAGDKPVTPELQNIDGSFKAGSDLAKAGMLMPATARVGMTFRQEVSLANAEDVTQIITTSYRYGEDADLDRLF